MLQYQKMCFFRYFKREVEKISASPESHLRMSFLAHSEELVYLFKAVRRTSGLHGNSDFIGFSQAFAPKILMHFENSRRRRI